MKSLDIILSREINFSRLRQIYKRWRLDAQHAWTHSQQDVMYLRLRVVIHFIQDVLQIGFKEVKVIVHNAGPVVRSIK